ncbi:hypothetical protein ACJIZ3_002475 [Penstemon smallii]|uniref:START domain-containing protein n=1 Tax=Penstemon smallii TaxID=265156 RepID=A0ABD3U6J3_9LAMI
MEEADPVMKTPPTLERAISSIIAQNERLDNNALRSANERVYCENLAMREMLQNVLCANCRGSGLSEDDKQSNFQKLKMENVRLKEEHERKISYFSNYMGKSVVPPPGIETFSDTSTKVNQGEGINITPLEMPQNPAVKIQEKDKSIIIETTIAAMNELVELLQMREPVWINSATDGRCMIHRDSYDKLFPKPHLYKTTSARIESSKDSGEVAMNAMQLIEMFLDSNKWKDLFSTIVTKARTIEVVEAGSLGGSLHLMYAKMHILSPLVSPREFFFIRYCRQLNSNTWVMVDVSYDFIKELQDAAPTRSWKLPSGCMIEDLSNGKSKITWIEHVQVDGKSTTHRLYRDLVYGCEAYGAKRWITTLQRMCERYTFSMGLTTTPPAPARELEGGRFLFYLFVRSVIGSTEGRRNLMKLSHRMVNNFCEVLGMSDKLEYHNLSELNNSGVRISLRESNGGLGQPNGLIVSAATSLWLPISHQNLFNFFKDNKKRAQVLFKLRLDDELFVQWDVLSNGYPVNAIANVSTGKHPGSCISIIQPFAPKETGMLLLQESSMDSLGGIIIYAPVDLPTLSSVVKGDDTTGVPILPSGYVISTDGRAKRGVVQASSSSSSTTSNYNNSSEGSLLTIAYQILVSCSTLTKQLNMESVATVHTLISSTTQKIKMALHCPDRLN